VSDFGDFDPDDAVDTEPADPEQVARKIQRYREERLGDGAWEDLTDAGRLVRIGIIVDLLAWMRRQGAT